MALEQIKRGGSASAPFRVRVELNADALPQGALIRVKRNGVAIGIASKVPNTDYWEYVDNNPPTGAVEYTAQVLAGTTAHPDSFGYAVDAIPPFVPLALLGVGGIFNYYNAGQSPPNDYPIAQAGDVTTDTLMMWWRTVLNRTTVAGEGLQIEVKHGDGAWQSYLDYVGAGLGPVSGSSDSTWPEGTDPSSTILVGQTQEVSVRARTVVGGVFSAWIERGYNIVGTKVLPALSFTKIGGVFDSDGSDLSLNSTVLTSGVALPTEPNIYYVVRLNRVLESGETFEVRAQLGAGAAWAALYAGGAGQEGSFGSLADGDIASDTPQDQNFILTLQARAIKDGVAGNWNEASYFIAGTKPADLAVENYGAVFDHAPVDPATDLALPSGTAVQTAANIGYLFRVNRAPLTGESYALQIRRGSGGSWETLATQTGPGPDAISGVAHVGNLASTVLTGQTYVLSFRTVVNGVSDQPDVNYNIAGTMAAPTDSVVSDFSAPNGTDLVGQSVYRLGSGTPVAAGNWTDPAGGAATSVVGQYPFGGSVGTVGMVTTGPSNTGNNEVVSTLDASHAHSVSEIEGIYFDVQGYAGLTMFYGYPVTNARWSVLLTGRYTNVAGRLQIQISWAGGGTTWTQLVNGMAANDAFHIRINSVDRTIVFRRWVGPDMFGAPAQTINGSFGNSSAPGTPTQGISWNLSTQRLTGFGSVCVSKIKVTGVSG